MRRFSVAKIALARRSPMPEATTPAATLFMGFAIPSLQSLGEVELAHAVLEPAEIGPAVRRHDQGRRVRHEARWVPAKLPVVERADVRMRQLRDRPRLSLESLAALGRRGTDAAAGLSLPPSVRVACLAPDTPRPSHPRRGRIGSREGRGASPPEESFRSLPLPIPIRARSARADAGTLHRPASPGR